MIVLLCCGQTAETGRALSSLINAEVWETVGTTPRDRSYALIRWGSTARVAYRPGRVLNPLRAVESCSDKYLMIRRLSEGGVPVPDFGEPPIPPFPVFLVSRNHTGGGGKVFVFDSAEVTPYLRWIDWVYWTKYIPKIREYRVHVFNGDTYSQRKVCRSELVASDPTFLLLRNHTRGWVFTSAEPPSEVLEVSTRAVEVLGLDFGAVDVATTPEGIKVFEVNTAPGLGGETLEWYANHIRRWINNA